MRGRLSLRRYLLAATWVAGTLLATAIVYAAVGAVAGQVAPQRSEPISEAVVRQALGASNPPATSASPTEEPTPSASASPASPTLTPPSGGRSPASPPPANGTSTTTRTFALIGGTASFSCSNGQISLNWAAPASGFQVDDISSSDGGAQIEVRFRSDSHESRVEAWCSGGQVAGTTEEQSS
jgi:hypothetical protein